MAVTTRKWIKGFGACYVREGVGTTVAIDRWTWSVSDDYRSGLEATYLDESGEWKTVSWEYEGRAVIDADEATMALYRTKLADEAREARDRRAKEAAAREQDSLNWTGVVIKKGTWVRVTAKRAKVKYGTEGEVFWMGDTTNRWGTTTRLGIQTKTGVVWTAITNVTGVAVPPEMTRRAVAIQREKEKKIYLATKNFPTLDEVFTETRSAR